MSLLLVGIAVAAAVAAGLGVVARGDGSTAPATSIRGEQYEYVTNGVYAFNAERVVAEGIGWDVFTLFVVVPGLVAAAWLVGRGSLRGRLFALGLLAYTFYQYLMYAMTWALGPLFPLWIVLYAARLAGIVWTVSAVSVPDLATRVKPRFPARGMAIFSGLMALALVAMWSQRIAAGLAGDYETAMLLGQTTMVVQALDLGLIVPLCVFTAFAAWARRPIGYLLASVVAIKGVTMSGAIVAMLVSAWVVEGKPDAFGFGLFGAAFVAICYLAWRVYSNVLESEDAAEQGSGITPAVGGAAPAR
jgi:hypothetical protein